MHRRALLIGLLLAVTAPGCGERPEPTGALAPSYPTTVRGTGEEAAVLRARPERIIALDPGTAELVAALGAAARLVAVPAAYAGERAEGAVVAAATNGRVDVAAATARRADLVATTPATNPLDARTVADETGATLYVQPDGSLADVERAAVELGYLVGAPVEARRLALSIRADAETVAARVARLPRVRVFVDTGFLVTIPPLSLASDLVARAGGVDVARDAGGTRAYDHCDIVRLRPRVFLRLTEPGAAGIAAPRFARCGRRGADIRYVELRADLVTRAGPRVAAALEAVARALHPDAF